MVKLKSLRWPLRFGQQLRNICHKWPRICSVCRHHNTVLSSFMTYHRVCNKSNTTHVNNGTGPFYPSGAPKFIPVFNGVRVAQSCFVDHCMFFFFWSLYCLSLDLRLLITPLVSCGHCIVCPSIYDFWLPLWYLLVIVLSVLWFTTSDYPFDIFWSLYCLSLDLRLLITPLVSSGHCIVCP